MKNHNLLRALSGENNVSNMELKAWVHQEDVVNQFFIQLNYKVFGFLGKVYKTKNVINFYVDVKLKNYKIVMDDFSDYYSNITINEINLDSSNLKTLTKEDLIKLKDDFNLSDESQKEIATIIEYIEKQK